MDPLYDKSQDTRAELDRLLQIETESIHEDFLSPSESSFPSPMRGNNLPMDHELFQLDSPVSLSCSSDMSLGTLAYAVAPFELESSVVSRRSYSPKQTNVDRYQSEERLRMHLEDMSSQQSQLRDKLSRTEASMRHLAVLEKMSKQTLDPIETKFDQLMSPQLLDASDPPHNFPYPEMFMKPLDHLYSIQQKLMKERSENQRLVVLVTKTQAALNKVETQHRKYHVKARAVFERQQKQLRDTTRRVRYVVKQRNSYKAETLQQAAYIRKLESLLVKQKPKLKLPDPAAISLQSVGIQTKEDDPCLPETVQTIENDDEIVSQLQLQMLRYYKS